MLILAILVSVLLAKEVPVLPEDFQADVKMTSMGFTVSGPYYRSYTHLVDRVDAYGQKVYTYYHCKKKISSPSCSEETITDEMYPMQIPPEPISTFIGTEKCPTESMSALDCDHWKVDFSWMSQIDLELNIWVTKKSIGGFDWVPVRTVMKMGGFFPVEVTMDFDNVVPKEFDIKETFVIPKTTCPNAIQDIDKCQGDIFPPVTEPVSIFVIDVSGSMSTKEKTKEGEKTRLQVVQEQLDKIINSGLSDSQKFNVMTFSSSNTFWNSEPVAADSGNKAAAVAWVQKLVASGGTYMYNALNAALKQTDLSAIYFLTDGEPSSHSWSSILTMVADVEKTLSAPVKVYATNFFGNQGANLQKLAEQTGGAYTDIQEGQI